MATIEEDIVEILRECENRRKDSEDGPVELQLRAVLHAHSGWTINVVELCDGWEGHVATTWDFNRVLEMTLESLDGILRSKVG